MSTLPEVKKSELPQLKDLVSDVANYDKSDDLNFLLNQPVPEKWIKHHPFIKKEITNEKGQKIKVPYPYLPIDKVEHLLRKIFKRHRIEITGQGQSFNGVFVTVRVWYWNPIFNEFDFHDGIGAIQLQVKSGSSPADLSNINNGALSMAYPLAKTLAVKDACDHLGELFGANLNRNDAISYGLPESMKKTDDEKLIEIKLLLELDGLTITEEDRMNIERIVDQKETISYNKCIKLLNKNLPKTN
jgi:hypothetical protein